MKPQDVDKALELTGKILNDEPITIEKSKPRTQEAQGGRVQGGMFLSLSNSLHVQSSLGYWKCRGL